MTGETFTLSAASEREARHELEAALEEELDTRVTVEVYKQRGRFDVQVDLPELKRTIEDQFPDSKATPYSDYKFTLSINE